MVYLAVSSIFFFSVAEVIVPAVIKLLLIETEPVLFAVSTSLLIFTYLGSRGEG